MNKKPVASAALAAALGACSATPDECAMPEEMIVLPGVTKIISNESPATKVIATRAPGQTPSVKRTVSSEEIETMTKEITTLALEMLWTRDLTPSKEIIKREIQLAQDQEKLVERYKALNAYDRARVDAGIDANRREWQNNPECDVIREDYLKILDSMKSAFKEAAKITGVSR